MSPTEDYVRDYQLSAGLEITLGALQPPLRSAARFAIPRLPLRLKTRRFPESLTIAVPATEPNALPLPRLPVRSESYSAFYSTLHLFHIRQSPSATPIRRW